MLLYVSWIVELGALLTTIWLGLYIITRSPHRAESWLAALTLWSMGGLFLNMLFSLSPPAIPAPIVPWLSPLLIFWPKGILEQDASAWLRGWSSTLSPVFWFHTTMLMRGDGMTPQRWAMVLIGYALAGGAVAVQAWLPASYNVISGNPLFLNTLQGGAIYAVSLFALVILCRLSIHNLEVAALAKPYYLPRRQLIMLSLATILGSLTGPLGLIAAFLKMPVPMFLVALLIAIGELIVSYGVARYSALMENRVLARDLSHSASAVFTSTLIGLAAAWAVSQLYDFPPSMYVLTGMLGIISHSLVDAARYRAETLAFRAEKRLLRGQLRELASQHEDDLMHTLTHSLEAICAPLQASYALLLARQQDEYVQVAAYGWDKEAQSLPAIQLNADDTRLLHAGDMPVPLASAALLLPIYQGEEQTGALLVGPSESGLAFAMVEIEHLQEFNDYLANRLLHWSMLKQDALAPPPATLVLNGAPGSISARTIELGLRNLHDHARLAETPLAALGLIRRQIGENASHIELGRAVSELLCELLTRLRPADAEGEARPRGAPRRDWYPYLILHDAYVNCLPNREIMDKLYISEGTFNRTRRSAIQSLARLLLEMESVAAN